MHQREDPFRLLDVSQALLAQVTEHLTGRKRAAELVDRASREQRLAARGEILQPCGAEQRGSIEAIVTLFDLAGHQRQAHPHAADGTPILGADPLLQLARRRDRARGVREGGVRAVADPLEDPAPMPLAGIRNQLVIPSQGRGGTRAVLLRDPCAALHVGEEEGQVLTVERHEHSICAPDRVAADE